MKRLIERGERIGRDGAARALDRAAEMARGMAPRDVTVEQADGELILSGRRLASRFLSDARLRSLGLALKEVL